MRIEFINIFTSLRTVPGIQLTLDEYLLFEYLLQLRTSIYIYYFGLSKFSLWLNVIFNYFQILSCCQSWLTSKILYLNSMKNIFLLRLKTIICFYFIAYCKTS